MRAIGLIEGGAATVAAALLAVLGSAGTLVVPTFIEGRRHDEEPIIDPAHDPSHMGWLSETVRTLSGAKHSLDYRHSLAAVGAKAEAVVKCDPTVSTFARGNTFGNLLALDAWILLLGVSYRTCTAMHAAELALNVPYRHLAPVRARVRQPDGSLRPVTFMDYRPKASLDRPYDLNKLGKILEEARLVRVSPVGNAMARLFRIRDLLATGMKAGADPYLFLIAPGEHEINLKVGERVVWGESYEQEWYVVDPGQIYRAPPNSSPQEVRR